MVWRWSKTAATNATADSTINWAEGMAPSAVNDSARAEMARVAQWRDDISGAILTTGTSTAYAVSSNQSFDTLAHLDGAMIALTPHTTNTGTLTLNVDGLGAKPLRQSPSKEVPSYSLIQGTPYVVTYSNSDSAFYLHGGLDNPYGVPVGGMITYIGNTPPNSAFVLPYGQALSRTTYATLFSLVGTYYGSGDGSTTFNIINMAGRVEVTIDSLSGSAANIMTGVALNTAGGVTNASQTLSATNLPSHTHSGTTAGMNSNVTHSHVYRRSNILNINVGSAGNSVNSGEFDSITDAANIDHSHNFNTDGGSGLNATAFSIAMPYRGVNKILRVI